MDLSNTREQLLDARIVLLGAEIDDGLANQITADLLLLDADDPSREITFYLNTPGGSVPAGMAIYDTMQLVSSPVTTVAVGLVAGMGLVLLATGAPGRRYALAHAKLQLMQPEAGPTPGSPQLQAEMVVRWRREIATILAERTGHTAEQIEADSSPPRWFTAAEAHDYGLVDRVADNLRRLRSRREMRERP